jgi:hypothetical protein
MGFEFDLINQSDINYIREMVALQVALRKREVKPQAKPRAVIVGLLQANPTFRVVDFVRITGLPQPTVWRHVQSYRKRTVSHTAPILG